MTNKNETIVSGCIVAIKDSSSKDGEQYLIRARNGQGWGFPLDNVTPDDLRVLANRLEEIRSK